MRLILVGGGTSGHINPALNIADYIKKINKNAKILYIGSKNGMEVNLAKKAGLDFKGITVSGFSRKFDFKSIKKNIISIKNILISSFESRKILKEFKPDICIGTGGYVMGAFLSQAYLMKIPFLLQEQNAVPGFTSKFLSKYAQTVFLGNKTAAKYLRTDKFIITGNPIKNNFSNINNINKKEAQKKLGITNNLPVILSFGGSLGSESINDLTLEIIKTKKYNHIHSYGKNNTNFKNKLKNINIKNINIKEYFYNIDECMAACDLIICRSGAMTLSELATLGKPAILIPSPNVTNNHQYLNAIAYAKKFTASVIQEKELNTQRLDSEISRLLNLKEKVNSEKNNACEEIYKFLTSFFYHDS